jgi:hypothetical protein
MNYAGGLVAKTETHAMQARADKLWDFMNRPGVDPGSAAWTRWATERRSLLRILYDVPLQIQLPLDWRP